MQETWLLLLMAACARHTVWDTSVSKQEMASLLPRSCRCTLLSCTLVCHFSLMRKEWVEKHKPHSCVSIACDVLELLKQRSGRRRWCRKGGRGNMFFLFCFFMQVELFSIPMNWKTSRGVWMITLKELYMCLWNIKCFIVITISQVSRCTSQA